MVFSLCRRSSSSARRSTFASARGRDERLPGLADEASQFLHVGNRLLDDSGDLRALIIARIDPVQHAINAFLRKPFNAVAMAMEREGDDARGHDDGKGNASGDPPAAVTGLVRHVGHGSIPVPVRGLIVNAVHVPTVALV